MLDEILDRLKNENLRSGDYSVIAEELRSSAVASGAGAIAIHGNVTNSALTTLVLQVADGDPINLSNTIIAKISEELRKSLRASPFQVLNNLPDIATAFTGRKVEEETIFAALTREGGAPTILALKGIGGVGKTALAVKIGYRLTPLFPAAQLLVDLRGTSEVPLSPPAAMESVIRRFYPEQKLPDDSAAIAEIYRDLLRNNKAFLILDNAHDAAQAGPLLPPPPSAAIVTSRQALPLAEVKSVHLDDLPLGEAKELMVKLFDGERSPTDAELTQLAQNCCLRHPLSLKVVALFLKNHKGRKVADYMTSVEKDRARLKLEGLADYDVLAVVGQSVMQLQAEDAGPAESWRDLCVFPADLDAAAADAVWSVEDTDAVMERPEELESLGLLEAVGEDRYRLHDLLRDIASRSQASERVAAIALRHARHFANVTGRANALYLRAGHKSDQFKAIAHSATRPEIQSWLEKQQSSARIGPSGSEKDRGPGDRLAGINLRRNNHGGQKCYGIGARGEFCPVGIALSSVEGDFPDEIGTFLSFPFAGDLLRRFARNAARQPADDPGADFHRPDDGAAVRVFFVG